MLLHFIRVVHSQPRAQSSLDRRCRVQRVTAEYRGEDGEVYRKVFEGQKRTPTAPQCGTHDQLEAARCQG